jgi:hypothetical protein
MGCTQADFASKYGREFGLKLSNSESVFTEKGTNRSVVGSERFIIAFFGEE